MLIVSSFSRYWIGCRIVGEIKHLKEAVYATPIVAMRRQLVLATPLVLSKDALPSRNKGIMRA